MTGFSAEGQISTVPPRLLFAQTRSVYHGGSALPPSTKLSPPIVENISRSEISVSKRLNPHSKTIVPVFDEAVTPRVVLQRILEDRLTVF
jgi:hypothetical protein